MKCSFNMHQSNYADWNRVHREEWSRSLVPSDADIWKSSLPLVELADDLGFDKVWCTEHHGTPYGQSPNPLTFLAYAAGRTRRIGAGTAVIVLPWWKNPLRAAEEISLVDLFLAGREFTVGFGRGSSASEFGAMGIDPSESQGRFREAVEVIRLALGKERFSFSGEYFQIPDTTMRPRPLHPSLISDMVGAFTSNNSMQMIAGLGLGMLLAGSKAPADMRSDVVAFNTFRARAGLSPVQPIVVLFALCSERPEVLEAGARSWHHFKEELAWHYRFGDVAQWDGVKGYESYHRAALQSGGKLTAAPGQSLDEIYAAGPPEAVLSKMQGILRLLGAREVIVQFHFSDLSEQVTQESMRLFAKEVMPALKEMNAPLTGELAGDAA